MRGGGEIVLGNRNSQQSKRDRANLTMSTTDTTPSHRFARETRYDTLCDSLVDLQGVTGVFKTFLRCL